MTAPAKEGLVTSELWLGTAAGYGVYEIAQSGPTLPEAVCACALAAVAIAYAFVRERAKRGGAAAAASTDGGATC